MKLSSATVSGLSFFIVLSTGCAHQQAVMPATTAAAVPAPPAPVAAPAEVEVAEEGAAPGAKEAPKPEAKPAASTDGTMSFGELSAQLGEEKLALDVNHPATEAPAAKGFNASGYTAFGAAHQATEGASQRAGDLKVSGGLAASSVRETVRGAAARLRGCYEQGLAANPRLAGRVTVRFSIDAHGAVSGLEAESDVMPANVTSCVKDTFSTMTFGSPSAPPAKVVYPVDFNQDS
jgi:hypothetical protein